MQIREKNKTKIWAKKLTDQQRSSFFYLKGTVHFKLRGVNKTARMKILALSTQIFQRNQHHIRKTLGMSIILEGEFRERKKI